MDRDTDNLEESTIENASITERILLSFLETLAATPDMEETAERLRRELIINKSTSDKAIRSALFGEDE